MGTKRKLLKRMPNVPHSKCLDGSPASNNKLRRRDGSVECGVVTSPPVSWHLFPSYSIHVVLFLIFVSRLSVVSNKQNWWILHPNEILHSLEVAYSEVYGYGFRTSEYLPQSAAPTPQHEVMYGMRSWLYPKFLIICLKVKEFLSIPTSPFMFMKNIHTVIASFIFCAVFLLFRNLQRNGPCWSDLAVTAAVLVGLNEYCILIETKTFDSSFVAPLTLLAYVLFSSISSTDHDTLNASVDNNFNTLIETKEEYVPSPDKNHHNWKYLLSGVLMGISCYIRPDVILEILVVHVFILSYIWRYSEDVWKRYFLAVVGIALGLLLGGYDDFVSYGSWFISFKKWTYFHYFKASSMYGEKDSSFYLNSVFNSIVMLTLLASTALAVFVNFVSRCCEFFGNYRINHQWCNENRETSNLTARFFLASSLLFLMYCLYPYKELHFIHTAIVLFLCSAAGAMCSVYHLVRLAALVDEGLTKFVLPLKLLVYSEVLMLTIQSFGLLNPTSILIRTSADVNTCLDFVSRQKDVTGLLVDYPVHWTGGYTLLHKDVPLIGKVQYDFREWSKDFRLSVPATSGFGGNISLALMERVSNYITEENGPLVFQLVVENRQYNYVVLAKNRIFPKKGFREIFRVGNVTVAKRIRSKVAEEDLKHMVSIVGKQKRNASVYQYEAGWLLRLNLPDIARTRLETALALEEECVGCWQLLNIATKLLQRTNDSHSVQERCYSALGREKCNTLTKGPNLHPGYYFGFRPVQPVPFEQL